MARLRVVANWKNIGNATIPRLTFNITVKNGVTRKTSRTYPMVGPGAGDRIEETFDVPEGYTYQIIAEALDDKGNLLARATRTVSVPRRTPPPQPPTPPRKSATIRIIDVRRGYVRVSVRNDGTVSGYFWIGCSICSSDWSQCFDIRPVREYLSSGGVKELSFWFSHDAMTRVVTKTPRIAVVAVWEGYDPSRNVMIPPRYSYDVKSYPY